jgi:hypothetical protein
MIPLIVLLGTLALPAIARADGLPILGLALNTGGVTSVNGAFTYTTRISGAHTRLRVTTGGRVIRATRLAGRLVVPVVAYDGSSSGLAADGRTLVLIRPRTAFPQRRTSLAIVDPRSLTVRRRVDLRGDFSFDAVAPHGQWLYLIQYTSPVDPTRYRVRALDARSGRLLPRDVVDPHDRGEAMHGNPITRAASVDGRWAYTLYDGNGRPFVHALDTAHRVARCLDLPPLPSTANPWSVKLQLASGGRLLVTADRRALATIDTRTLSVVRAVPRRAARPRTRAGWAGGEAILAAAAAIALLAAAYGARRSIVQRAPAAAGRAYRSRS